MDIFFGDELKSAYLGVDHPANLFTILMIQHIQTGQEALIKLLLGWDWSGFVCAKDVRGERAGRTCCVCPHKVLSVKEIELDLIEING